MSEGINVFSMFDGISCGQYALHKSGIKVNKYYAAEIDQRAIKVTQKQWPKTIQYGDVTKIKPEHFMSKIHLLIGGSPCQGFSFAGKQLNFDDPRSKLFFEYVRMKKELNPDFFFLENVRMKKIHQDVISEHLGCEPIYVNSKLVSAQNRQRLYWTNIPGFIMPEDRGILLEDIIEDATTDKLKSFCIDANYAKGTSFEYYEKKSRRQMVKVCSLTERRTEEAKKIRTENMKNGRDFSPRRAKELVEIEDNKANCLTATIGIEQTIKISRPVIIGHDESINYDKQKRVYSQLGKSPNLDTQSGGGRGIKLAVSNDEYRKLTPIECERLQGLPDNYTKGISTSARYHALGNGWQVDTIIEFFKNIPQLA